MKFSAATAMCVASSCVASIWMTPSVSAQPPSASPDCSINQWVSSNSDDRLVGTVVMPRDGGVDQAIGEASVQLIGVEGAEMTAQTDSRGGFTFRGVRPGIYTLRASTEGAMSVTAVHVVDHRQPFAASYPKKMVVGMGMVDAETLDSAVKRYVGDSDMNTAIAAWDDIDFRELNDDVTTTVAYRVRQTDGGMNGRIHVAGAKGDRLVAAANTNVLILRGAAEVTRVVTDQEGRFRIDDLEAGEYSVLAAGNAGVALVGIELIDVNGAESSETQAAQSSETDMRLVALNLMAASDTFTVQLAPSCCGGGSVDAAPVGGLLDGGLVDGGFGTPLGGGGGGLLGGGGGGGGGLLGGGGGRFAALAGIGGIIAAAVSDDDDDDFDPDPDPVSVADP